LYYSLMLTSTDNITATSL